MRKMSIGVGQIYPSKSCGNFKIIEIESYKRIKIQFVKTGYETWAQGGQITDGRISDKLSPTIYGVATLGLIGGSVVGVKSYKIWHAMIQRCYSTNAATRKRSRTYKGVTVCKEWLTYANFKVWFDDNYIDGYCLDKDLTIIGSKEYSPQTCSFIPNEINCLLLRADNNRGDYPLGVHLDTESGKFAAQISVKDGEKSTRKHLGYFITVEDAFYTYKMFKEDWVKKVAERSYRLGEISETIYKNLLHHQVEPY